MKVFQAILALILVYPTFAKAQQPSPKEIHSPSVAELKSNSLANARMWAEYWKTHTPAQAEAEFRSNTIAYVEKEVAEYSRTKSPYFKFADGKVAYLGKLLYEQRGILELPDFSVGNGHGIGTVILFTEKHTVEHAMTNGCHIRFPDSIRRDGVVTRVEMFVQDLSGTTNQVSEDYLIVQYLGNYECKPASGEGHTISLWTLGKETTKQEYLDYVASLKKKP